MKEKRGEAEAEVGCLGRRREVRRGLRVRVVVPGHVDLAFRSDHLIPEPRRRPACGKRAAAAGPCQSYGTVAGRRRGPGARSASGAVVSR